MDSENDLSASGSADGPIAPGGPAGEAPPREIFAILDAVLGLQRDGGSAGMIVAELDRLLETTRNYFREEEIALALESDGHKGSHLEVHRLIIDYIVNLRSHTDRFDQTRLLPQLRFLDYWLTTHITEHVAGTP